MLIVYVYKFMCVALTLYTERKLFHFLYTLYYIYIQ